MYNLKFEMQIILMVIVTIIASCAITSFDQLVFAVDLNINVFNRLSSYSYYYYDSHYPIEVIIAIREFFLHLNIIVKMVIIVNNDYVAPSCYFPIIILFNFRNL